MNETERSDEVLHMLESDLQEAAQELFEAYGIALDYAGPDSPRWQRGSRR